MVPGLTEKELDFILNMKTGDAKNVPDSIFDKAEAHALKRKKQGKSLFFDPKDKEDVVNQKIIILEREASKLRKEISAFNKRPISKRDDKELKALNARGVEQSKAMDALKAKQLEKK